MTQEQPNLQSNLHLYIVRIILISFINVMRDLRNRGSSAHSRTLAGQTRTTEDMDTAEMTPI